MNLDIISAVVNGILVSAALVGLIAVLFALGGRRFWDAPSRYAIWCLALLITAGLPLLYFPWAHLASRPGAALSIQPMQSTTAVLPDSAASTPVVTSSGSTGSVSQTPLFPVRLTITTDTRWFLRAWILISTLMLLRIAASHFALARCKARSRPSTNDLELRAQQWMSQCGSTRRISVRLAENVMAPVAVGPAKPAILLPSALLGKLTPQEVDQIGIHEAAHFARRDDYTLLAQRIVEALLPFHPAIHWITRQMNTEREIACDDVVLRNTGNADSYAECLARVAEFTANRRPWPLASSAVARRSMLEHRIDVLFTTRDLGRAIHRYRRVTAIAATLVGLLFATLSSPQPMLFARPVPIVTPVAVSLPAGAPMSPPVEVSLPVAEKSQSGRAEPIEKALVKTRARVAQLVAPQISFAVEIVLDRSGSMGGPKIEMAKQASREALTALRADQYFGLITFNYDAEVVVPLQPVSNKTQIQPLIDKIVAVGETNIYPALGDAEAALVQLSSVKKHVILISDGRSLPADYDTLVNRMTTETITLSAIALGAGFDRSFLATIAALGHGRMYYIEDSSRLPELVATEIRIAQTP